MARAQETLALARMDGRHPFVDALKNEASVLMREPTVLPPPVPELARRYTKLTLAGRGHRVCRTPARTRACSRPLRT